MECIYLNIAVPLENGQLSSQFGYCNQFRFYEIDARSRKVIDRMTVDSPPQALEKIPGWLRDRGIHVVIARKIDADSIGQLEKYNLRVVNDVTEFQPDQLINHYLNHTLTEVVS